MGSPDGGVCKVRGKSSGRRQVLRGVRQPRGAQLSCLRFARCGRCQFLLRVRRTPRATAAKARAC